MAKNNTNDELAKGKKLLKDMTAESGFLYDALTSIGVNIASAIEESIDGATDLNDIGKTIKSSARGMDKLVGYTVKINKGQNVSKQLNDEINKVIAKREVLKMKIEALQKTGVKLSEEEVKNLEDALDLEEEEMLQEY